MTRQQVTSLLVLLLAASATQFLAYADSEGKNSTTPSNSTIAKTDGGFKRVLQCLPNMLFTSEDIVDDVYKNWWTNPNNTLPGIITSFTDKAFISAMTSAIPALGLFVGNVLVHAAEGLKPQTKSLTNLMNFGEIVKELTYIKDKIVEIFKKTIEGPCLKGTEEPYTKEKISAEFKKLKDRITELGKEYLENMKSELTLSKLKDNLFP